MTLILKDIQITEARTKLSKIQISRFTHQIDARRKKFGCGFLDFFIYCQGTKLLSRSTVNWWIFFQER